MYELKTSLETLQRDLDELDGCILKLDESEQEFNSKPSLLMIDSIDKQEIKISTMFHNTSKHFKNVLSILDSLIVDDKNSKDAEYFHVPSMNEAQVIINEFFKGNVKKASHPIPFNCGCCADKIKSPHPGDFICARCHNSFFLMIVWKFENQICYVFDPTALESGVNIIELHLEDWTPLPTSIPEIPTPSYEYSKSEDVLSLWKADNTEWTTEFYKAKVLLRPSDKMNENRVKNRV